MNDSSFARDRAARDARRPGPDWNDLAAADSRRVPDYLLVDSQHPMTTEPLDVARYVSPEFFQAECSKMWPKVWQFVARVEELPEPGSYVLYENAGRSFLVVRQEDGSVRAFHNVCLHRGRRLRSQSGSASSFICPYHGFSWDISGELSRIPCKWDFNHLEEDKLSLPEAEVGEWGGYIFLREEAGGPSLEEYLAPLPEHFARWRHDRAYTMKWTAKVIPANWKACAEAFMEAYHVSTTHPQIMPFTGDTLTKYALYGDNVNVAITPFGILSPNLGDEGEAQKIIDNFVRYNGRVVEPGTTIEVPEGKNARQTMGDFNRERFGKVFGMDLSEATDAEVQDAFTYNVFPNFSPWGGFQPTVVYRWRPWPDEKHTLMEVRLLGRLKEGETAPVPEMVMIAPDESFESELGQLGYILEQDMRNLPEVQKGMERSKNRKLELGQYQESRIRHFHETLDKYLAGGDDQ
nr:aromatic ring-hydroxylating dioxygenase subunit alpha [Aquisediminimonas sediminicola]